MRRRAGARSTRAQRRGLGALLGALLLASCSTDATVRATRSDASTTVTSESGSEPVATEETPEQTVPLPPTTVAPAATSTVPGTEPDEPAAPAGDGSLQPSGDGAGDTLFPDLGNPGVDVLDYDVALGFDHDTGSISGIVTMAILLTDDRTELTLDSAGPTVSHVTVDGTEASFEADGPELRVALPSELAEGTEVDVGVEYTVTPTFDGNSTNMPAGWFNTDDGSYVLNEPDGARTWLPSNDHPSDKATWTFSITVKSGATAVANGALVSSTDGPEGATWMWRQEEPMPTYQILMITGQYELVEGTTPTGLPLLSAVLREDRSKVQPYLDSIGAQIDFFDDLFGPYPLDRYGLAVTDSVGGLAMETHGRSLFSRADLNGDVGYLQELLLSHELAHQWYGNAVSPLEWQDVWLNESFATYGQWMWLEHAGLTTVAAEATGALDARAAMGGSATGLPTANELFGYNSYDGGAVVLHALRSTIGDDAFFTVLRRWIADNTGTSRSTEDFILLAEDVAGRDLGQLFDAWLYSRRLPKQFP